MGFRFSIEHANWLAHILQPSGATPRLPNESDEEEALRTFIGTFERNFYPSRPSSIDLWRQLGDRLSRHYGGAAFLRSQILGLREYFSDVPWVALLLPSGRDYRSDQRLTSRKMLRDIVEAHPDEGGLILQLEEAPREAIALQDIFPAFKTALVDFTRWPGLLLWTPAGDSLFLELTTQEVQIGERLSWIFDRLAKTSHSPDLEDLKAQFDHFFGTRIHQPRCHILHISDLHLGSRVARRRMSRVQNILRTLVAELGDDEPIVPIVTGDLMDTPTDDNLSEVRTFLDFLGGLGCEEPVITVGNHDVRTDGWLSPRFRQAVNLPSTPVVWLDESEVTLACFNSVNSGRLARGRIGSGEMADVGNAIDRHPEKSGYTIIAALHHHPLPVERPDWYRSSWYERILGDRFETTEALEDAPAFLRWLNVRRASAVLHGHKHIPRFDCHEDVAVIGCGSTVGKVDMVDEAQTYISLNVITVDRSRNSLSCRLRAERVPGAGLESVGTHEIVLRSSLQ